MVVFGHKWLYSSKSGFNLARWLSLGKVVVLRAKVVVLGQKWLYSGKVVVFGQKLYSCKVVVLGQKRL